MALPTLDKTYTIDANRAMAAGGTVRDSKLKLYNQIKTSLVASGKWSVSSSSNAALETKAGDPASPWNVGSVGTGDNWSSASASTVIPVPLHGGTVDLTASRFPWIVYQSTTLGCQVVFSEENGGNNNNGKVYISPGGLFTGGTAGARPTATDEIVISNGGATFSGADTAHKIDTWVSTDGEVTRVMVWRGTTNMCIFWDISKPKNPSTNWTPQICMTIAIAAAGIAITYSNLQAYTPARGKTAQSGSIGLCWTAEGDRSGAAPFPEVVDVGTVVNTLTGLWHLWPIGICSKTVGSRGKHGVMFDMWWKPGTTLVDADTFPNNAATRQFVCAGPLVLPWTGDGTVMALI